MESGNVPPREDVSAGEGRPARTGMGETSPDWTVAEGGASDGPAAVGVGVAPREEVKAEGVPGRLGVDAEGGGSGERVRRPMEAGIGVGDCADGE